MQILRCKQDHTICRLICAFVLRMQQSHIFTEQGSYGFRFLEGLASNPASGTRGVHITQAFS